MHVLQQHLAGLQNHKVCHEKFYVLTLSRLDTGSSIIGICTLLR